MQRLSRNQKEKVQQFVQITGSSDRTAVSSLRLSDWTVEAALEYFYSRPQPSSSFSADSKKLNALFEKYKDPEHDIILVDGITKLCDDLKVDPADIVMLVLSYHLKAATACEYTKSEFIDGLRTLGVDSIEKLKNLLPKFRTELEDDYKFKEIYLFAFSWAREKGQKSLALDTAVPMWNLLFEGKNWSHLDKWNDFVQEKHNKAISKDTWTQLLDFAKNVRPDLSNYDEDGAWPYLIDEYVEYLKQS